jgi:hypothetical protein
MSLRDLRERWDTAWHKTPDVFAFSGAGGPLELGRTVDSVGDAKITVDVTDARARIFLKVKLPDEQNWSPMAMFLALQREVAEVDGSEITAEITYWNNVVPEVPIEVRSGGPPGTRVDPFRWTGACRRPQRARAEGRKGPKTLSVNGNELDLEEMCFANNHEMVWAGVRLVH